MKRFMKRIFVAVLLSVGALFAQKLAPPKPKLILAIAVDQFRYDYLLRFNSDYTSGLRRLLDEGAVFHDAQYQHFHTVTAVGHSTFLSGATPAMSGIIANEWYDRETKATVTSVSDPATSLVGGVPRTKGSSPRRMLVSTLGDEIKMQGVKNKVIGVSIKDRSAILPVGHMADAAYWYDNDTHHWVTSSYFMESLPEWVKAVNDSNPHMRAFGESWFPLGAKPGAEPFCTMVAGVETRYCGSLEASPWGNEMIEEFAERAISEEKLGQHDGSDVLAVSFSSNDYVGHAVGPDDPSVRDISIRTDRLLGKLFDAASREAGAGNVLVVLTADHGVAPVPEVNQARRMPGGRLSDAVLADAIQNALSKKFGAGKWVEGTAGQNPYFDLSLVEKYHLNLADVERAAADAVRALPHIFRAYTAAQLRNGEVESEYPGALVRNGYYAPRSPDLIIIPEEYYLYDAAGTSHGTPFKYDTHVPVIFMGAGIKAGNYYEHIVVNDIAPTLAAIARVAEPSGSVGRVLQEIWQ